MRTPELPELRRFDYIQVQEEMALRKRLRTELLVGIAMLVVILVLAAVTGYFIAIGV